MAQVQQHTCTHTVIDDDNDNNYHIVVIKTNDGYGSTNLHHTKEKNNLIPSKFKLSMYKRHTYIFGI